MAAVINSVKSAFVSVPHEQPKVTHDKRILLAVTGAAPQMPDHQSGFFWGELIHPAEVLMEAGWDVDIVSENGTAKPDENSLGSMALPGDKKKWDDNQYPIHHKLANIRPAANVSSADYAGIYFAGGHACCVDLPGATALQKLTREIYEKGGIVGADCHGIAVFQGCTLSNGEHLIKGKEVTGFSTKGEGPALEWMRKNNYKTMQEIVEGAGGRWTEHASNPMADYTVVSDRVVTGMNPASAASVGKKMLTLLPGGSDATRTGTTLNSTNAAPIADKDRTVAHTEAEKESRTYQGERTTTV